MKLLFVCLGNICRSPLAEGIMQDKIVKAGLDNDISVDSVGFEPFHQGDPPDPRAIQVARDHGIDISNHRARLFRKSDFTNFDFIYIMDKHNYLDVIRLASTKQDEEKVDYLLNVLTPGENSPVPDPWYGNLRDFEHTYSLINAAAEKLIGILKERLNK